MGFKINDKTLILDITDEFFKIASKEKESYPEREFVHPLDEDVKTILERLKPSSGESIEYSQTPLLDDLWETLIDKSIKCLRFFDNREPFQGDPDKIAVTYGLDKLKEYHERYTKFESLLYGASSFYRDHVFHAVRTWMLGIFCLMKTIQDGGSKFVEGIGIDGVEDEDFTKEINFFEKISMWTIIALCHDLGYPLEKSQHILDRTREMMKEFIHNPNIWNNFGFSGIQDNINEYIVKFMSTKMKLKKPDGQESKEMNSKQYIGRIQPKYYLKYTKSLERFDHGIVSAVILYKMLLYFLESDFNLNDDYEYTYNDARQFYIRREILRAMSSHTCSDIYNIHLTTFSSLLFFCDELQEWGRKSWNELYAGLLPDEINLTINNFVPSEINVHEDIDMSKIQEPEIIIKNVARIFERQYAYYKLIFRDGQYTENRNFNFIKNIIIQLKDCGTRTNSISIEYTMNSNRKNFFQIDISKAPDFKENFMTNIENTFKKLIYYKELVIKI
ncbi:hypothetical protein [Desulfosporosinus fructosivorans]